MWCLKNSYERVCTVYRLESGGGAPNMSTTCDQKSMIVAAYHMGDGKRQFSKYLRSLSLIAYLGSKSRKEAATVFVD